MKFQVSIISVLLTSIVSAAQPCAPSDALLKELKIYIANARHFDLYARAPMPLVAADGEVTVQQVTLGDFTFLYIPAGMYLLVYDPHNPLMPISPLPCCVGGQTWKSGVITFLEDLKRAVSQTQKGKYPRLATEDSGHTSLYIPEVPTYLERRACTWTLSEKSIEPWKPWSDGSGKREAAGMMLQVTLQKLLELAPTSGLRRISVNDFSRSDPYAVVLAEGESQGTSWSHLMNLQVNFRNVPIVEFGILLDPTQVKGDLDRVITGGVQIYPLPSQ